MDEIILMSGISLKSLPTSLRMVVEKKLRMVVDRRNVGVGSRWNRAGEEPVLKLVDELVRVHSTSFLPVYV